ncbi:MAG: hypothetical protein JO322_03445 [Candidatus Eremiobacteraeota bacterium]|nr:hypothetical protein [Candidatus Eremiobacteraeota bacterium]
MIRAFAALAATIALSACGGGSAQSTSSPSPASRSDLRNAFQTSFLRSCLGAIPGKAGAAYCRCSVDRLEASFTDDELARLTPDDPKFRAATHACAEKAGLRVAPGH